MNAKLWRFQTTLLKYVGLWPAHPKNFLLRTIFWLHLNATIGLLMILETISWVQFANNGNFVEFVKTSGTIAYHFIGLSTVLLWLQKFQIVVEICEQINRRSFANFCVGMANRKFVQMCCGKAKFWSVVVLVLFEVSAIASVLISYVGICLFPQKMVYGNGTVGYVREKPYQSYTFLNSNKVSTPKTKTINSSFFSLFY